jgi:hypothetical protein
MVRRDGYQPRPWRPTPKPSVTEFPDVTQGTPEWDALRRGVVTASIVGQLITVGAPDATTVECPTCEAQVGGPCLSRARKEPTPVKTIHEARTALAADQPPTYSPATGDVSRGLAAVLVAERITGHTDPTWQSNDMLRGQIEEPIARDLYSRHFAEARETGFMVRDEWGFKIGWSPDGLVGDDGAIEIKSRRQKKHLQTMLADEVPPENIAQVQCALLVSGRAWIDYVSYCGGMPLWVKRVEPDQRWHDAIVAAVGAFEDAAVQMEADFYRAAKELPATERIAWADDDRMVI